MVFLEWINQCQRGRYSERENSTLRIRAKGSEIFKLIFILDPITWSQTSHLVYSLSPYLTETWSPQTHTTALHSCQVEDAYSFSILPTREVNNKVRIHLPHQHFSRLNSFICPSDYLPIFCSVLYIHENFYTWPDLRLQVLLSSWVTSMIGFFLIFHTAYIARFLKMPQ